jgi:predicted transcriptional regulator
VAIAPDITIMNKYVSAVIALDKSKAFGVIEPFDGSRFSTAHTSLLTTSSHSFTLGVFSNA